MDVEPENSTNSLFYTTRRSAELLREDYPLGHFGIALTFVLLIGGFISNCFLFDWLRSEQNSTRVWVKHLVCWNNADLAFKLLDATLNWLTQIRLAHYSSITCRAFRFSAMFLHCGPLMHAAAVFIDQALFITIPTWHYTQNWKKEIPVVSAAIAIYSLLYSSPMVVINDIRFDSCETTFVPLWNFLYTFNFILASSLVASSNIVFIVKLRQNRLRKNNGKQNPRVATIGKGNKKTAETNEKLKYSFSAEDMKAIKVMAFFLIATLLSVLTFSVLTYLVRQLADTQFQMDIFFWVILGWLDNFGRGLFTLLGVLSRESSRRSIMERYFK